MKRCEAHRDGRPCPQIANSTLVTPSLGRNLHVCGLCASLLKTDPSRIRIVVNNEFGQEHQVKIEIGGTGDIPASAVVDKVVMGKPKKQQSYAQTFIADIEMPDGKRARVRVNQAPPEERN